MNPLQFYLLFDVKGNAPQQLASIASQFGQLGAASANAAASVQSAHGTVIALIHALHQMQTVGSLVERTGVSIASSMGHLSQSVFETASEFETLHERINFAFGDNASQVWENINRYAVDSVYTFRDVSDVVGGLGIAVRGLDQEFMSLTQKYTTRTGQQAHALEVMGDVAAGTGRSLSMIGFEVEQMMSGVYRGAHMVLRLTQEETNEIKHAVAATHDSVTQFEAIMRVLALHYGGATEQMSRTFSFLMMQIPDIAQVLAERVGRQGLGVLAHTLNEIVHKLRELSRNEAFLNAMSDAFVLIASAAAQVGNAMVYVVDHLVQFVSAHPEVVKIAVVMAAVGSAVLTISGALIATLASIGVFVSTMSLASAAITSGLGTAITIVLSLGGALAGIVAGARLVLMTFEQSFGGVEEYVRKAYVVVSALVEALGHWHGDIMTISGETEDALQGAGVFEFFVNLVSWIARGREYVMGFVEAIKAGFNQVDLTPIRTALYEIQGALAQVGISLHLFEPAAETSFETMRDRGFAFGQVINQVVVPALNLVAWTIRGLSFLFTQILLPSFSTAVDLTHFLLANFDGIRLLAFGLFAAFNPVLGIFGILVTATGQWETVLTVVAAVFRTVVGMATELVQAIVGVSTELARLLGMSGANFDVHHTVRNDAEGRQQNVGTQSQEMPQLYSSSPSTAPVVDNGMSLGALFSMAQRNNQPAAPASTGLSDADVDRIAARVRNGGNQTRTTDAPARETVVRMEDNGLDAQSTRIRQMAREQGGRPIAVNDLEVGY